MTLKRKTRNAVGGKKAAKAARKKTSARSRRAKGAKVGAAKLARRGSRAARAKNATRRRPVRRRAVARRKNLFGFGGGDTTKFRGSLEAHDTDRIISKHIPQLRKQVRQALADAKRRKQSIRGVDLDTDVDLLKNPKRKWASVKRSRRAVKRNRRAVSRNAFGLDRFIGRKKRVTSESYQRAGASRRSRAYQRAGVPKKLGSTYANLDWKELQQLDPGFVKKVMRSLNPRSLKKLRSVISSKIRQLRKEGVPQKQSVTIALREARSGYLKPKGAYRRRSRRNPDSGIPPGPERAGEKYAMFHGRGAKQTVVVNELAPEDLAALGDLCSLVLGKRDYQITWGKGEKAPLLAVDADCDQLYIVGGNQALPDSLLSDLGVSGKVDVVDLGEVNQIEYFTQKGFDNFRPIVYYHQFGEEDAKKNPRKVRRPRLLYSRRYKKLMLAGGGYKIKKEGIIN